MPRIFVVCNTAWSLYHFRLGLICELRAAGYDVWTVSPPDDFVRRLREHGVPHLAVPMSRKGTNPFEDALLTYRLYQLFRTHRPDAVLTFRAKPNIYCSLAARTLGIPVLNTITGLGTAFTDGSPVALVARLLYRMALRGSTRVIFQNTDDLDHFVRNNIVHPSAAERVAGSGVNTGRFAPSDAARKKDRFVFLFVGRLLWDKGIGEYVEAAGRVRELGLPAECRILGYFDPGNPSAIPAEQMAAWTADGAIRYLGATETVEDEMRDADCVVLPSYYREGLPRSLLEAAAMGKPLIAADTAGCRDVVRHGETGFLCRARDPADLARKMIDMLNLSDEERHEMGCLNRERAFREFDERIIVQRYLGFVRALVSGERNPARATEADANPS